MTADSSSLSKWNSNSTDKAKDFYKNDDGLEKLDGILLTKNKSGSEVGIFLNQTENRYVTTESILWKMFRRDKFPCV